MRKERIQRRRRASLLQWMIIAALAIAAGRIAVVTSPEGDTAFLSANDRSRWCTIASLVEDGTYAIDRQIAIVNPVHRNRRPWGTIDKVRHVSDDGKLHYYSSKPPLFPTLAAGVYKLLHLSTGLLMTDHPIYVPRILLMLINLPLLAVFLLATTRVLDVTCVSRAGKAFGTAATCFGTMMLPFTVSLNNHLAAASATALTMAIYVGAARRMELAQRDGSSRISAWWWTVAGAAAALAAANELPALSMTVFWFGLFAWLQKRSIVPFSLGVVLVAGAFFGTNWIAHESLRPPYAHRGNGQLVATLNRPAETASHGEADVKPGRLKDWIAAETGSADPIEILPSDEPGRSLVQTGPHRFALLQAGGQYRLHRWDDWYEYPDSYWQDGNRRGVDQGEPSRWVYFLQMTVGHYGIFSLSPIWLLLPLGFWVSLRNGPPQRRKMVAAVLVATIVCIAFYLSRPTIDRNYGGVSTCFRWLLWFAPLWLSVIAPVFDQITRLRRLRMIAGCLLAASVFSMSTALSSPWQSPWLYRFWQFLGWIEA